MAEVILYTTTVCPFCVRAKSLLQKRGAPYQEINLTDHPERREEMIEKAGGRRTVPQIFINGRHVGGCDDLYELETEGTLEKMLAE
ncbi:MAG: glutaredoxin 3 [Magnetococcus sp. MYC-9]